MTLIQRLRLLFSRENSSYLAMTPPGGFAPASITDKIVGKPVESESVVAMELPTLTALESLPDWLLDDELLRDEGVLFGLSNAPPDGKLAQIRAAFAQQTAPLGGLIEQYSEKIATLNLSINQRDTQVVTLRNQLTTLSERQPVPIHLARSVVGLVLAVMMCVGNFYLIGVTLQPSFPNRWIAVGVFMAGMFNLFGRTSFLHETESKLSIWRFIEEIGMPLATSVFILVQSLQTQSTGLTLGLFFFSFFLFLLGGKLLPSTLTALQNELAAIQTNRQLVVSKAQYMPVWASQIDRLEQEIDAIRSQKWPITTLLNQAEAKQNQLNAQRDRLVNLFLSEFELARSLRERLTDQQRKLLINYE